MKPINQIPSLFSLITNIYYFECSYLILLEITEMFTSHHIRSKKNIYLSGFVTEKMNWSVCCRWIERFFKEKIVKIQMCFI